MDDNSVRKTFKLTRLDHKDELDTAEIIEKAVLDIKGWMDQVCLKMNESKTEFIYFGGNRQLEKYISHKIDVNGEDIQRVELTRNLGAYLDLSLHFREHKKTKCKADMINLLKIRAARKFLTRKAWTKMVISLVISHLD